MTVWNWVFFPFENILFAICDVFIIGHLTIERNVLPFVILNSYLFFSIKYTALFNVRFSFMCIDIFITIFAYLSHLTRPYSIQKRFFFFSINDTHAYVHKCVMNTIRSLHFLRIKYNQYSTVNLVHIWIEPLGYICVRQEVAHVSTRKKKEYMMWM